MVGVVFTAAQPPQQLEKHRQKVAVQKRRRKHPRGIELDRVDFGLEVEAEAAVVEIPAEDLRAEPEEGGEERDVVGGEGGPVEGGGQVLLEHPHRQNQHPQQYLALGGGGGRERGEGGGRGRGGGGGREGGRGRRGEERGGRARGEERGGEKERGEERRKKRGRGGEGRGGEGRGGEEIEGGMRVERCYSTHVHIFSSVYVEIFQGIIFREFRGKKHFCRSLSAKPTIHWKWNGQNFQFLTSRFEKDSRNTRN